MTDPSTRVCPRCGSEDTQHQYCGSCGLHLIEQPELPTRAEWEERQAAPAPEPAPPASSGPWSKAFAGVSSWLQGLGTAQKVIVGLVVVVVVAIAAPIAIIATSGGDDANRTGSSDVAPVESAPSDAETCVDRWNSGATESAKQLIGIATRNSLTTYVSAFFWDVPGRCLITVAQPDSSETGSWGDLWTIDEVP